MTGKFLLITLSFQIASTHACIRCMIVFDVSKNKYVSATTYVKVSKYIWYVPQSVIHTALCLSDFNLYCRVRSISQHLVNNARSTWFHFSYFWSLTKQIQVDVSQHKYSLYSSSEAIRLLFFSMNKTNIIHHVLPMKFCLEYHSKYVF